MTKRVLFVDDEPIVLRGIERGLRTMRHQWEMHFVEGGPQALQLMSEKDFDVVVSDMRMPGMDGAELLQQVRARFPRTVRMALSGQSDQETVFRAIGPTHQYLSKPCDADRIKEKLMEALALRDLLDNNTLREAVSRIDKLPSQPDVYDSLCTLLDSTQPSLAEIAKTVGRDPGMTAKLLQIVNSSFLGAPLKTLSLERIVSALGVNHLKTLVFAVGLFSRFEGSESDEIRGIWQKAQNLAEFAQAIAQAEGATADMAEASFLAGLLQDVGRLILATTCLEQHQQVLANADAKKMSITSSEAEILGCTHAQIGAYLLGLWGLPRQILEAVTWHHEPRAGKPEAFCPLVAVHAAEVQVWKHLGPPIPPQAAGLDEALLEQLGLNGHVVAWEEACKARLLRLKSHG